MITITIVTLLAIGARVRKYVKDKKKRKKAAAAAALRAQEDEASQQEDVANAEGGVTVSPELTTDETQSGAPISDEFLQTKDESPKNDDAQLVEGKDGKKQRSKLAQIDDARRQNSSEGSNERTATSSDETNKENLAEFATENRSTGQIQGSGAQN